MAVTDCVVGSLAHHFLSTIALICDVLTNCLFHCKQSHICEIHFAITICFSCLLSHIFAQSAQIVFFFLVQHLSCRQRHFAQFNCFNCLTVQPHLSAELCNETNINTIKQKQIQSQRNNQFEKRSKSGHANCSLLLSHSLAASIVSITPTEVLSQALLLRFACFALFYAAQLLAVQLIRWPARAHLCLLLKRTDWAIALSTGCPTLCLQNITL